jgi:DNA-binding transcriptional LysR family regulator
VAVPLGTVRRLYVGSPALLTRLGRPREPADLARGPCVSFSGMGATNEWSIADGRKTTCVAVTSVLATNQIDAATSACIAGLGWGCFFDYHVAEALRSGQLVEVLDHLRGQATPVNIVYPQARLLSPNVRAFVDFAAPRLRARLGAQH